MNLRTRLSSGTGMTKLLAGKQIALLSASMTLNLACTSLMIRKYQRYSSFTQKKLEKMSLTWNSNMKLKKRSIKHIKQTIKTNESSAPGPN